MATSVKKGRSNLKMSEALRLMDWVRSSEAWLKSARPTYEQVASRAERELGFTVSKGNVRGAAVALNLTWDREMHCGVGAGFKKSTMAVLAASLVDLYQKLNEPVPAELRATAENLHKQHARQNGTA